MYILLLFIHLFIVSGALVFLGVSYLIRSRCTVYECWDSKDMRNVYGAIEIKAKANKKGEFRLFTGGWEVDGKIAHTEPIKSAISYILLEQKTAYQQSM